MIYLDSCAAIKLVWPERESAELATWLSAQPTEDVLMSSTLLRLELHRALHRVQADDDVRRRADALLGGLHLHPVDSVLAEAAGLEGCFLRSLDAIHLATAFTARSLTAFVTYDKRLAEHAQDAGLTIMAPGRAEGD